VAVVVGQDTPTPLTEALAEVEIKVGTMKEDTQTTVVEQATKGIMVELDIIVFLPMKRAEVVEEQTL
jgi:hypothetical protein